MDYSPQAALSVGFFRQEYWSGLPCPSPGDLPDPGIEPVFLMSPDLAGGFLTTRASLEFSPFAAAKSLLTHGETDLGGLPESR